MDRGCCVNGHSSTVQTFTSSSALQRIKQLFRSPCCSVLSVLTQSRTEKGRKKAQLCSAILTNWRLGLSTEPKNIDPLHLQTSSAEEKEEKKKQRERTVKKKRNQRSRSYHTIVGLTANPALKITTGNIHSLNTIHRFYIAFTCDLCKEGWGSNSRLIYRTSDNIWVHMWSLA